MKWKPERFSFRNNTLFFLITVYCFKLGKYSFFKFFFFLCCFPEVLELHLYSQTFKKIWKEYFWIVNHLK